jgi:hypothetical protein
MRRLRRLATCVLLASMTACSAMATGSFSDPDARDVDDVSDVSDAPDVSDVSDVSDVVDAVDTAVPEDCATPFDDNGDGRANEGCPCEAGATRSCFERPSSAFEGMCRMGSQRCGGDGTWAACEGSWLPDAAGRCEITERFSDTSVTRRPVDVVWFVDTSSSMVAETAAVNANVNRFSARMAESGLDYRVVMIAQRGTATRQVCVPPPLGGAACGDGPRFRHVNQYVASRDGLQQVLDTYPTWRGFLRPGTARVLVAVTDDDSTLSADAFDTQLRALGGWDGYVFNSIVGYESRVDCPTLTRRGSVYLTLTDRTMGQRARVCDPDWSGTFTAFARTIASRVTAWTLSSRPRLDTLQVWLAAPGEPERRLLSGWTYDPATARLTLEPEVIPTMGSFVRVVYRTGP